MSNYPSDTPSTAVEHHYAIIEQTAGNDSQRTVWERINFPRMPLMHQKAFAHLRDEGPWLVALGDEPEASMKTLQKSVGDHAILAWITSYLPLPELSGHLGDALVVQLNDGRTLLLRSYLPGVLPVLHARQDCSWHAGLFGPINSWRVMSGTTIDQYSGGGLEALPDYEPIILDAALIEALAMDQQAMALLEELQRSAPHVFATDCFGERLEQVERALSVARETDLVDPEDHCLFATLYLLEGHPPSTAADWPAVMLLVTKQKMALGQALETLQEGDLI